jgi:hypothetical protein
MVLDWFFGDVFEKFYTRVERLQKFVRISKQDLKIDHYVELRRHFKEIKRFFPEVLKSYEKEVKAIDEIPDSDFEEKLTTYALDLQKELDSLEVWISNALNLIEEVLRIRVMGRVQEQKEKIVHIVSIITGVLVKAQRNAFELVKMEKAWKKNIKKTPKKPIAKIRIVGKLSNGWRLSNIQSVILDLGGYIEPGGNHRYKIRFSGRRSLPLAESTPPFALVKEVSARTGIEKSVIIASFYRGELVAA